MIELELIRPYLPHIVLTIILSIILYNAHKNSESPFNVFDYFVDPATGKTSISRTLQMLAGITSTWVVVKLTVAGSLTTEMFFAYMAAMGISEGWSKYIGAKFTSKDKE